MYQADYDHIFKIMLIGNSSVGKSSLLMRFADDIFSETFLPTIGVDFKIRTIEADGSKVKLQMWDTAGQERFKSIVTSYYKGTHGILLVFDLTNMQTFRDMEQWLSDVEKHGKDNVVKLLVGNKKDMDQQRQVPYEEAAKFAESLGVKYIETSAKSGENIEESFVELVVQMKKKFKTDSKHTTKPPSFIRNNPNVKKTSCC